MKAIRLLFLFLLLLCSACGLRISAQAPQPKFHTFTFDDQAIVRALSDNGRWAVCDAVSSENAIFSTGARLVDLSTDAVSTISAGIPASTLFSLSVRDITNDGRLIVGERNLQPAYFNTATQKWTLLPLPQGCNGGYCVAVTPDGRRAVGRLTHPDNDYEEEPALWDLTTNTLLPTPNLPTRDMAGENQNQMRFCAISADGDRILGCMSFSSLPVDEYPGGCFYFVYHVSTASYQVVGFQEHFPERWTPMSDGMTFIPDAVMSNNGRYVSGTTYLVTNGGEMQGGSEMKVPFRYDVEANSMEVFTDYDAQGRGVWAVGNSGTLYTATPTTSPIRNWAVRTKQYDVDFDLILKQKYNYDFSQTGYENTGTPHAINDAETCAAAFPDPYHSYLVEVSEPFYTLSDGIDLLGTYAVSPQEGVSVSKLQRVVLTFPRQVEVLGAQTSVQILNAAGTPLHQSVAVATGSTGKQLLITFRRGTLTEGEDYTLFIPAGTLCVKGDASMKNRAIRVAYKGRANQPVGLLSAVPASGGTLSRIDAISSPIMLTFDAHVALTDTARAFLYMADDAEPLSELVLFSAENQVAIASAATQYLYKGAQYRVCIAPGSITDAAGGGANEEITLTYAGAYEREVSYDDKILFSEDFNNGLAQMLLYDADRLTPSAQMQEEWGFADATNYPWWVVRDTETNSDMAAASHSMYTPAGKAQDWMSTPQLFLPDELCTLHFQAQSYKRSKQDRLKVFVYADESAYNFMNATLAEKIRQQGVLLFDELLSPGASEEQLEGEWTDYTLSLAPFAGKSVYIAFLNENENQSAVFLDNVRVVHDIPFLVTLDHLDTVTAQESIRIKGRITIDSDRAPYTSQRLTLFDEEGREVSRIEQTGLQLENGKTYPFEFPTPLPLRLGRETAFSLAVALDDTEKTVRATVKNLAFAPRRHVVLEEMTGMGCQNCPLGILAIERLEKLYGESFIPVSLHTYSGDILGRGLSAYSDYFNFPGAPTGVINRSGKISYPMTSVRGYYEFLAPEGEAPLWGDLVAAAMEEPAEAEVAATAAYNEATKQVDVDLSVRYALDAEHKNLNLFAVLLEDDVVGYQQNTFSGKSDPNLGAWGAGGEYAESAIYPFYHKDVARAYYGTTVVGTPGLLPTTLQAGTPYDAHLSLTLPSTLNDLGKTSVVVMLLDADTEGFVNAVRAPVQVPDGIHAPRSPHFPTDAQIYRPDGRRASTLQRGVNLVRGNGGKARKIFLLK